MHRTGALAVVTALASLVAMAAPPPLRLPAAGPARPVWLTTLGRLEWLDWSAEPWRIPGLDGNPLLLGEARFRGAPATVVPRLEKALGPRGGTEPHNPIFVFEREGSRFLARVVPVVDAYTGREQTSLIVVAWPEVANDCVVPAPPGARVLPERWLDLDRTEFSRPATVAVFAGGGDDAKLRAHFLRTLESARLVTHGLRTWVAGRACGGWVLATFQDKTPWDEKAWVTRVVPAPPWIVAQVVPGD